MQEFEGTSWVGIVPFRTGRRHVSRLARSAWVSAFPELNLRLYVEHDGKPGVWFLSLDATNPLAVWAARRFFHLPYYGEAMRLMDRDSHFHYSSSRRDRRAPFTRGVVPANR